MDPMRCRPLGGSVTTVTEYTGSVDTLCQLNSLPAMSMVILVNTRVQLFFEYEIDENHIPIYL